MRKILWPNKNTLWIWVHNPTAILISLVLIESLSVLCFYEDSSWLLRGLWFMRLYFRSVCKPIGHNLKNPTANRDCNVTLFFQAATCGIIDSIRTIRISSCSFLCFLKVFSRSTELFLNCFNDGEIIMQNVLILTKFIS